MRNKKRTRIVISLVLVITAAVITAIYTIPIFDIKMEVKTMGELVITSKAFANGGNIPAKYTEKGGDRSPPLEIKGVDPLAKTIAIIADDPDIPIPFLSFTHWVMYNIPADISEIPENVPREEVIVSIGGAMQGKNGFRRIG